MQHGHVGSEVATAELSLLAAVSSWKFVHRTMHGAQKAWRQVATMATSASGMTSRQMAHVPSSTSPAEAGRGVSSIPPRR